MLTLNSKADSENLSNPERTSSPKTFTKDDIRKLADFYIHNNLNIKNPALVDVDGDEVFDLLNFNDGNVEYYRNAGTLEEPEFVLYNKHFDSYKEASFLKTGMPMPIFFADKDGDGDLDLFAVKETGYNTLTQQNEYKVYTAENALDLDTGTLITIILVLAIVLLVLLILR
jgi:FG-GAP-like repeat